VNARARCPGENHTDCNGYIGPLDTFACLCPCHEGDTDDR
jgi:hypothetical protein